MDHNELATICNALGDPTRAHIFQFLLGCCCPVALYEDGDVSMLSGSTAGEICCHVTGGERITSTVSFHLDKLKQAGLVKVERRGKHMVCSANRDVVAKLAAFFDTAKRSCKCCDAN